MMRYAVNIEPTETGFFVRCPDIPEALTEGRTLDEALEMAKDAIETALEFYVEDGRPFPMPTPPREGDYLIIVNTEPA